MVSEKAQDGTGLERMVASAYCSLGALHARLGRKNPYLRGPVCDRDQHSSTTRLGRRQCMSRDAGPGDRRGLPKVGFSTPRLFSSEGVNAQAIYPGVSGFIGAHQIHITRLQCSI